MKKEGKDGGRGMQKEQLEEQFSLQSFRNNQTNAYKIKPSLSKDESEKRKYEKESNHSGESSHMKKREAKMAEK